MRHRLDQPNCQDDYRQDKQDVDQSLIGETFPPIAPPSGEPQDEKNDSDD